MQKRQRAAAQILALCSVCIIAAMLLGHWILGKGSKNGLQDIDY